MTIKMATIRHDPTDKLNTERGKIIRSPLIIEGLPMIVPTVDTNGNQFMLQTSPVIKVKKIKSKSVVAVVVDESVKLDVIP